MKTTQTVVIDTEGVAILASGVIVYVANVEIAKEAVSVRKTVESVVSKATKIAVLKYYCWRNKVLCIHASFL